MKRIFLYAYDHVNLGDDLFIRTIVNRYPNIQFYIWSDKKNKLVFQQEKNLKIIDKKSNLVKVLSKLRPSLAVRYQECYKKRCDACVYIGGSIFMEYDSWKNIVNWWKYQVENYPFYILGANFGPYKTEAYREQMNEIFQKAKDVCFRDKYSYDLFKDNEKVRYAPDILFSYPMPKDIEKKKQVFISVIHCQKKEDGKYEKYQEEYENVLLKMIEKFSEQKYQIKLVSFCKEEGDEEMCQILKEKSKIDTKISCLNYDGTNHKIILEELVASEYVIASRFHAIVLALSAGKNVLPIIYSDKSKNILDDLGYKGQVLEINNMKDNIIEQLQCYLGVSKQDRYESVKRNSKKHFVILNETI